MNLKARTQPLLIAALVAVGVLAVAAGFSWRRSVSGTNASNRKVAGQAPLAASSLRALLAASTEAVQGMDIARLNLLCAQGLPGADAVEMENALAILKQMAARVRSETERHLYRFKKNPAEFENSEGFFRMVMLAVVLAEDFQVKYAPAKMGTAADARLGDGFFQDAEVVFLHGLLGPRREGTCSSLPVLYVAVGRRLGYPLKLVTTKGHLFVRWKDGKERFNVEATGRGVNRFPDEYYRHWPLEVAADAKPRLGTTDTQGNGKVKRSGQGMGEGGSGIACVPGFRCCASVGATAGRLPDAIPRRWAARSHPPSTPKGGTASSWLVSG